MTGHAATRAWSAVGWLPAVAAVLLSLGCQGLRSPAARHRGPLVQAPTACADFTMSIYFEANSASVTRQARALLQAAADRARGCDVTGVKVLGLADAPGDSAANLALSKRRADAVTLALHRQGFDKVAFQVAAAGAAGAQTKAGQDKPVHRRVDVDFHLADRPPPAVR